MKVVLVHGLGRTRFSLALLRWRLAAAGHVCESFSYWALFENQSGIVSRLVVRLRRLAEEGKEVGLVGHSFGGLLLRQAVAAVPELRVKHLVMLGTPNRRPRLAVRLYTQFPYGFLRGSCGRCLTDAAWFSSLPVPTVPYTLISGTGGWRGGWTRSRGNRMTARWRCRRRWCVTATSRCWCRRFIR